MEKTEDAMAKKNDDVDEYEDNNKNIFLEEKIPDFSSPSSLSSSSSSSRSSAEFDIDEEKHTPRWSMLSSSPPLASVDLSSSNSSETQTKSPPVQTMGDPPGYDPNRIPLSVFSTKPANTSDWSVASNESLFSIHMGNNSFSRDQILFGKSGELPRLDETKVSQSNELSTSLPPVIEHEESCPVSDKGATRLEKKEADKADASVEVVRLPPIATKAPDDCKETQAESNLNLSSTPRASDGRLSDESGNSNSSFAFPVLVSDSVKPGSLKVVAEKPELEKQNSEKPDLEKQVSKAETPKAPPAKGGWFSCFSCWPRCC